MSINGKSKEVIEKLAGHATLTIIYRMVVLLMVPFMLFFVEKAWNNVQKLNEGQIEISRQLVQIGEVQKFFAWRIKALEREHANFNWEAPVNE